MTRLVLLLLLVPSLAFAQAVTFTHVQPTPGLVRSSGEGMSFTLDLTGSVEGTTLFNLHQTSEETVQRIDTVRSWSDKKREVDVTYGVVKEAEVMTGPENERSVTTHPVSGRSYRVAWTKKGGVSATRADGSPATTQELERLTDDLEDLGDDDRFSTYLASRSFEPGERVAVPKDTYDGMFGDNDGLGVDSFTLTLKETRLRYGDEVAVFDVVMTMSGMPGGEDGPPMTMTMPLAGTFIVRTADSWPVLLEMAGPLTAKGSAPIEGGVVMDMIGTGSMTITIDGVYGAP
jgi:hypothetical protein